MGSGWLVSALCVALAPLYAACGVGNQTAQLSVNTPTLRLPSGVSILGKKPTHRTLCCVRQTPVRFPSFQPQGFFSLLSCWPSHCRRVYGLCTCEHP